MSSNVLNIYCKLRFLQPLISLRVVVFLVQCAEDVVGGVDWTSDGLRQSSQVAAAADRLRCREDANKLVYVLALPLPAGTWTVLAVTTALMMLSKITCLSVYFYCAVSCTLQFVMSFLTFVCRLIMPYA